VNGKIKVRIMLCANMATQLWNFKLLELHSVWFVKNIKDVVPRANIAT
jgi:hypothetical protein